MKETEIKFALWLREVDTQERADEWFGYSDEDMFNYFMKSQEIEEEKNNLDFAIWLVEQIKTEGFIYLGEGLFRYDYKSAYNIEEMYNIFKTKK